VDADTDADPDVGSDADADAPPDGDVVLDETACDDVFSTALFCDGFEDATLSAWPERDVVDGALERVGDPRYRGVGALRAAVTSGGGTAAALTDDFVTVGSGEIYFRAYCYIPSGQLLDGLSLVNAGERAAPYDHVGIDVFSDDSASIWINEVGRSYGSAPAIVPRDVWLCVLLHVGIGWRDGTVELSIDGAPVASGSGTDTLPGVRVPRRRHRIHGTRPRACDRVRRRGRPRYGSALV
jgi:hypothetical protein